MQAILRAVRLSRQAWDLTIEAVFWLFVVRVAFGVLPFARALALFGITQGEEQIGRSDPAETRAISQAVVRAASYAPFRAVCLQQSFTAFIMLRRRGLGVTVRYGVSFDGNGKLIAHAWSMCGEMPVTGVRAANGFVPLAKFVY